MEQLAVWAERLEGFVRVGALWLERNAEEWFEYDGSYLQRNDAAPIYPPLPLRDGRFNPSATRAAFFSLGPEGRVGYKIRTTLRAGRDSVLPVLARLNHETVGALCFCAPDEAPAYGEPVFREVDEGFLKEFATEPESLAYRTMLDSRLSLNGAVSKIGLVRRDDSWLMPMGLEPTTHILKAGSPSFPNQMLNEAICMRCARACGFDDAAETSLIVADNNKVLLVSKRFDRAETRERPAGLPSIMRLHQADFCQLMGISVDGLKYTPSDELVDGYNTSFAATISRESSERYGDRSYIFDAQVFNYLVGNCDNHLKNYSMTWQPDWRGKSVSPIYDVTCTTLYIDLSRDMGMGIGQHRRIDQIDIDDFRLLAHQLGLGKAQARQSLGELSESFKGALLLAARELESEYGVATRELARRMLDDSAERLKVVSCAANQL
ncbi:MAG: HipA domain-containing protein [Atopobiaceae bacterium]|nr:HipA domain-containing protein [Atopobiaceae bacterium]